MLAIIETGGKQYKVQENNVIDIEILPIEDEKEIIFDKVLLIKNEDEILLGKPYLEKAVVKAEIVKEFKDKKVIVFKFKRKTGYKKTQGHRQNLLSVKIKEIIVKGV
ncbi:MAG: 50S ribosomal protein L21 [Candidatus Margulisiibacteriota bacterium]|jgi:large subunit ribosomal protein L21